jgi:predicted DNA-binding protein (UPF0251 family)
MTTYLEHLIDDLAVDYGGSVAKLSHAMGIHRATLHKALARGRVSVDLMRLLVDEADRQGREIDLELLIDL